MTESVGDSRSRAERSFAVIAIALFLILVVLLCVLLRLLAPRDGEFQAVGGLRPLLVLYGPGTGEKPLFDNPMGVGFDQDGRIYVADSGNSRIVVFDRDGRYLLQFGGFGVAKPAPGGQPSWKPGLLNYPTDVVADDEGLVYVADFRNDQIQVFDTDGRFVRAFPDCDRVLGKGASGQDGKGIAVTSLATSEDRVFATDKYQVVVFDKKGRLLNQFGKPGDGPAEFDHPNGIAVSSSSAMILVVADSNNGRLQGFDLKGTHGWTLRGVSEPLTSEEATGFEVPRGLAPVADGSLLVSDGLASRLVLVSAGGEVTRAYGQRGDRPGELNFPTDVAVWRNRIGVADKGNGRVQVLVLER